MKLTRRHLEIIEKIERLIGVRIIDDCTAVTRRVIMLDTCNIGCVNSVNIERVGNQYGIFNTDSSMNGRRLYIKLQ